MLRDKAIDILGQVTFPKHKNGTFKPT